MNAVDRGVELMRVPMRELPHPAIIFAGYLCKKLGMCGEVMLSAYATYAQVVEGLPCDDDLYFASPSVLAMWEEAQRDYVRVEDPDGRLRVKRRDAV